MTGLVEPYRVSAYNTAKESENKIHDDAVAQKFGFSGGLVPGVEVLAYMMHQPIVMWGRDFLARGLIEGRFLEPVYDGETAEISAKHEGERLAVEVHSRGELCAVGFASLPRSAPAMQLAGFRDVAPVRERRPVDTNSYPEGKWLGTAPRLWSADDLKVYLDEIRERDPVCLNHGLVHPGVLQRLMNRVMVENAILGPWIHVGSRMQLLAPAAIGDTLTARAKVIANYEKKGHRFVELDALVVANDATPVARCHHIAIYQPRQLAAA